MLGFPKKKPDPLAERTRDLNAKIAALENEIKELQTGKAKSKAGAIPPAKPPPPHEPVFETLPPIPKSPAARGDVGTGGHYNDLGARKFDLIGAARRIRDYFRPPPAANPKLVSYLAAGSIKGLRPLRYEKRVARNRFIALFIFFVLLLWGILAVLFKQR